MPESKQLRAEYVARINRVIDHIEQNLDRELSLTDLARVATFSPYHFHRIFGAMVGEPLNRFVQRLRIEKAATQLISNPNKTITEVALDCGFSGSATFARAFHKAYGKSASEWRAQGSKNGQTDSKNGQTDHKNGKDPRSPSSYHGQRILTLEERNALMNQTELKMKDPLKIDILDLPEVQVAYVRHIGPYKGDGQLFGGMIQKLIGWAGPRGLLSEESRLMCVYHDNPELTDEQKLRTSMCLSVPAETAAEGEFGRMAIASGKYVAAHFELAEDEYQFAWNHVMGKWLPESGYQPDDRPSFERYYNDPKEHPEGKCIVDICVPVKPL